jgi:hypothetical protein
MPTPSVHDTQIRWLLAVAAHEAAWKSNPNGGNCLRLGPLPFEPKTMTGLAPLLRKMGKSF